MRLRLFLLVPAFFCARAAVADAHRVAIFELSGPAMTGIGPAALARAHEILRVHSTGFGFAPYECDAKCAALVRGDATLRVAFLHNGEQCLLTLALADRSTSVDTSCSDQGLIGAIEQAFLSMPPEKSGGVFKWLASKLTAKNESPAQELQSVPVTSIDSVSVESAGTGDGHLLSGSKSDTTPGSGSFGNEMERETAKKKKPLSSAYESKLAKPVDEPARPTIPPKTEPPPKSEPPPKTETRKHTESGEVVTTESGTMVIHDEKEERPPPPMRPPPQTSGMKAGASDDNLQFNAFLRFLGDHRGLGLPEDVSRRVTIKVRDHRGLPIGGARVVLRSARGEVLLERTTYADGRAMIFPSEAPNLRELGNELLVGSGGHQRAIAFQPSKHEVDVQFDHDRTEYSQTPIDIAFILDTTGSMDDEIDRLKKTIDVIHYQIQQQTPKPDIRFGMVLYRDREDDYVTQVIPFTSDMLKFRYALHDVQAGGGGDTPEDMQSALSDATHKLAWRNEGVRVAFLIGDAPPHLDYGQTYTYVDAMRDAARRGIKIAAIGASGLPIDGEVVWRQIAQYTMAPFVFLTHGESGDSEGSASTVSHHVGSNWVADNLDAIIIRMVKVELAHFAPNAAPEREDYFQASATPAMTNELVLGDLFQQSVKQLTDYAIERVDDRTPTLMLPIASKEKLLASMASKLEGHLALALQRDKAFKLVEKERQPALLAALTEQFAARYDEAKIVEVGKLVPARLAIAGELGTGAGGELQLVVKLIRMETGEVLSLSLLKVERALLM